MSSYGFIAETTPILMFVGWAIFILGVINLLKKKLLYNSNIRMSSVVVMITTGFLVIIFGSMIRTQAQTIRWDEAVDNGYSFYLDGQEVDPELINSSDYRITYDEDSEQVILSQKPETRTVFFFIPR